MTKSRPADIAVVASIGQRANAHAVQHDPYHSGKRLHRHRVTCKNSAKTVAHCRSSKSLSANAIWQYAQATFDSGRTCAWERNIRLTARVSTAKRFLHAQKPTAAAGRPDPLDR